MSDRTPYETLGVTRDASFEEIQNAKSRLSQQYRDDSKLVESIEAAYDAIIMDRLKMRQEGKIKVPERIRFPERTVEAPPKGPPIDLKNSPPWLQGLVDTPSRNDILLPAGVFVLLAAIALFNPLLISLMLALGFGATVYFINRKENRLGRAMGLALVGLLVGIGLGLAIANLNGLGGAGSDSALWTVMEELGTTFLIFWLMSSFLR